MVEERITETTDQHGNTHTTHTVESGRSDGGGGFKWVLLLVVVIALAVGGYMLTQANNSEIAMNDAVADAASDVGDAAGQVGDAAQDAADSVNPNQ